MDAAGRGETRGDLGSYLSPGRWRGPDGLPGLTASGIIVWVVNVLGIDLPWLMMG